MFRILLTALVVFIAFVAFESYSSYRNYEHFQAGSRSLIKVQDQLSIADLTSSEQNVIGLRTELLAAGKHFRSARDGLERDPALKLASEVPEVDRQAIAMIALAAAADELVQGGLEASEVFLAFVRYQESAPPTLRRGQEFVASQQTQIARVQDRIAEAKLQRAKVHGLLLPPIVVARDELDRAIARIDALMAEYEVAATSGLTPRS